MDIYTSKRDELSVCTAVCSACWLDRGMLMEIVVFGCLVELRGIYAE